MMKIKFNIQNVKFKKLLMIKIKIRKVKEINYPVEKSLESF